MAKRPLDTERASLFPFSFTWAGETFRIEIGKRVPHAYFMYRDAYAFVRGWLCDWLREEPRRRYDLRRQAQGGDVQRTLWDGVQSSPGFLRTTAFSREYLKLSICDLPADALREILQDLALPRYQIPNAVPQWTFQEARNTAMAIAEPTRSSSSNWRRDARELALLWSRGNDALEVRFFPSRSLKIDSYDSALKLLATHTLKSVICFQIVLDAVIRMGEVTIDADDLIRAVGFTIKSADDRIHAQETIWAWLQTYDSLSVIGTRRGQYRGLDLRSNDALVKVRSLVTRPQVPENMAPIAVTLSPGAWLEQHRNNLRVLSFFGDVMRLARIPYGISSGKVSNAWALSIGLGLFQRWREQASRLGAQAREVSRQELFTLFPPEPPVEHVLRSAHPKRAKDYWRVAIDTLTRIEQSTIIRRYVELDAPRRARQNWQRDWLEQRLDIELVPELTERLKSMQRASDRAYASGRNGA